MCGINGIFRFRDKQTTLGRVAVMNKSIEHRGPDSDGIWSNDVVVLGHRRLSIIDTSDAGRQPFHSEDQQLSIVFNGEIYNYIELKKELSSDFVFKTGTDTEVLLAAYKKWGFDLMEKLIGMFAFALWDEQKQALLIVRDRMGIKPVYYHQSDEGFVFSSELRPLLASGIVPAKINSDALAEYLRYQTVFAPNTMIENVHMLMPGHYMVCTATGREIKEYWNPVKRADSFAGNDDYGVVKKKISDLLHSSVELRMRADVPFGAFLSGGIDSSIIVGLMSNIASQRVQTFSVTFHEKEFDESPYSEMIAKKFNTKHHDIRLNANHFLTEVPDALMAMDHPSGDGPNTFVVSKVTRAAGVKMALSGLGGDEVFAGYDVFTRMHALASRPWINAAPQVLRSLAGKTLKTVRPNISSEKIAATLSQSRVDFAHAYPLVRQLFMEDRIHEILKPFADEGNRVFDISKGLQKTNLPLLSKVSVAEMTAYMQNILLRDTDQMSMAHALEVRVPFLDHRLVEYVLGVGDEMKFPTTPKKLLTDSVGDLIPRSIIDRPKMGFTFPWSIWMKNELRSFCEENLQALEEINSFNPGVISKYWELFLKGDKNITWSRMWPLVVLGHWIKQNNVRS